MEVHPYTTGGTVLVLDHKAPTLPESEVLWLCVAGREGRVMADLNTQHALESVLISDIILE